jgi:hypothetical protein
MRKLVAGLGCVLGFTLMCCVDTVDIGSIQKTTPKLAVDGGITDEARAHVVRVSFSHDPVSNAQETPATGAVLSITDGTNVYLLHEISSGVYATADTVKGEIGKQYTLTIDHNGNTYTASDVMPEPVPFDNGDNVFVYDKWVFGGKERGFEIEYPLVTYGAIAPVKTELTVLPAAGSNDGRTVFYFFPGIDSEGLVPTTAKELNFAYGDTIQQRKMAISNPYYLFLRAVLLETKYYGGVLSSVPANVPTNVSNGAVGFFSASASITRKSLIK